MSDAPAVMDGTPWWHPAQLDARLGRPWIVAIAALALLARLPDIWIYPQFWAEDGWMLFKDDYLQGWRALAGLSGAHFGYQIFVPRAAAWVIGAFPARWAPGLFCYAALGLTLLVVALVASPRMPLPGRSLLALLVVLVPNSGEVFGNLINIISILPLAVLALVISEPARWRGALTVEAAAVVALGLTGPNPTLLVPGLLLYSWMARREMSAEAIQRRWVLLSMLAAAAVVQAVTYRLSLPPEGSPPVVFSREWLTIPLLRIVGRLFVPRALGEWLLPGSSQFFHDFGQHLLLFYPSLAVVIGGAAAAGVFAFRAPQERPHRVLVAIILGITLLAALLRQGANIRVMEGMSSGDRYFFLPQLMTLWFLVLLAGTGRWQGKLALALVAWSLVLGVRDFPRPALTDQHWAE